MTFQPVSRRSFLKKAGVIAGSAAVGASLSNYSSLFGIRTAFAQTEDDDLQTIINLAATAELFASTHYLAAINNADALGFGDAIVDYLKAGFIAEWEHYQLLVGLGAEPVATEFYVPENLFSDAATFAAISEVAETTFVSAYLAATRIFAGSEETVAFAVTTAQIAGVEAEHRALVRQIGGLLPNDRTYQDFQFMNVSDAVPVLEPFLTGEAEGFVGPVSPPTEDDAAGVTVEGYNADVLPFAAM